MANKELTHYGVLGMKWGVRKKLPKSNLRVQYDTAKKKKKQANSEYGDNFETFYKNARLFTSYAPGTSGERRLDNMIKSLEKSVKADARYRKVKNKRKKTIKTKAAELERSTSFKEQLLYNPGTRTRAAKYIIDNDMPLVDAKKLANQDAIRNASIILAGFGLTTLGAFKLIK